jgi:hypothetical protein
MNESALAVQATVPHAKHKKFATVRDMKGTSYENVPVFPVGTVAADVRLCNPAFAMQNARAAQDGFVVFAILQDSTSVVVAYQLSLKGEVYRGLPLQFPEA